MNMVTIGATGMNGGKLTGALLSHDEIIRVPIADAPESQMREPV